MPGTTDYSGWLAAAFSGTALAGGLIAWTLSRFSGALGRLRTELADRIDEAKSELVDRVGAISARQEELEMAQGETNRLAIRAAAQSETLVEIFGHAGLPGGGRRSDPPPSWPPSFPRP